VSPNEFIIRLGLDQGNLPQASAAAAKSIGGIGTAGQVSARQTAAAMRTLPAQFTDIATQLAGGQNPLLVLLQQGGQIKDSFGGIGPAIRGVGAALSPVTLLFGGLAAGIAATVAATVAGQRELQGFKQALTLTGNAAGTTADQMTDMAQSIAGRVGTQGSAAEALTVLASTAGIAGGDLEKFGELAVRMQRVTGKAVGDTAKVFADLAKQPLQASVRLNESVNFLTTSLIDQIAKLEQQGKKTDAARLAQQAYFDVVNPRLTELESKLGGIEGMWNRIADAAGRAFDKMMPREETMQERLESVNQQLQRNRLRGFGDADPYGLGSPNAALEARRNAINRALLNATETASGQAASASSVQDYAAQLAEAARLAAERAAAARAAAERAAAEFARRPAVTFDVLDARDGRALDLQRQDAANGPVDAFFNDAVRRAAERDAQQAQLDAEQAQRLAEIRGKIDFELQNTADRAGDALSESLAEGILDGFRNGGNFADVFLRELKAQFAKTVLAPILRPTVEAGNSIIADILKGLVGSIPGGGMTVDYSGAGTPSPPVAGRPRGGMATGTNFVPRDMLALLHRGEAVVPAKYNNGRGMGGNGLTYAPQISIDSRTDQAQIAQLVTAATAEGQRQMVELLKARGVI
jgi:phage-related minor tail protein